MNKLKFLFYIPLLLITACGEGKVSIDNINYKPKIVIRGLIFPGQPVSGISITRNLPIREQQLTLDQLIIADAKVVITNVSSTVTDTLVFDPITATYYDPEHNFSVQYNTTYKLDVTAHIDGKNLNASSETTVPQQGFNIIEESSLLDSLHYRERDEKDSIRTFTVRFERSVNAETYLMSMNALDADTSTYVYSPVNPYSDLKPSDVLKDLDDFKYSTQWSSLFENQPGQSEMSVFWFFLSFYGRYQMVVYAADENYSDFINTYDQVQDIDGNYDEPVFHIDGDGIGVFGSAIADTVYFKVLKP